MKTKFGHERQNAYCEKCGNNVLCTFRRVDKSEKEIIERCANYNGWIGTKKYHQIIQDIEKETSDAKG